MKKGKVKIIALGHKNGRGIMYAGDTVTENDVDNFDELVKAGKIEVAEEKKIVKKDPISKK